MTRAIVRRRAVLAMVVGVSLLVYLGFLLAIPTRHEATATLVGDRSPSQLEALLRRARATYARPLAKDLGVQQGELDQWLTISRRDHEIELRLLAPEAAESKSGLARVRDALLAADRAEAQAAAGSVAEVSTREPVRPELIEQLDAQRQAVARRARALETAQSQRDRLLDEFPELESGSFGTQQTLVRRLETDSRAAEISRSSLTRKIERLAREVQSLADQVSVEARALRDGPPEVAGPGPEPPSELPPAPPSLLDELETELRRQLITKTEQHPKVRWLMRRIDAERERRVEQGDTETVLWPGPVRRQRVARAETRLVADTGDDLAIWRPQTRSYADWQRSRRDLGLAEVELASLSGAQERRAEELASLRAELQALESKRAELEELRAVIGAADAAHDEAETELTRLQQELDDRPAPPAGDTRSAWPQQPLAKDGEISEPERRGSLPFLPWLLASLLLGGLVVVWVEAADGSFHDSEDLRDHLGRPLLGVIPHLGR